MIALLSTSPLLTSLSLTLLHFLWQGLLVAVVLKSALLIFNNHKPQVRYALSALAMLTNLILPIITFAIIYQAESTVVSSLAITEFIQELKQPDALFNFNELAALLPSLLPYIAIFWIASIFLLAGKLLFEIYNVNNLPQHNTVAPSEKLQARFNELANQINLTIKPRLLISLKVDVPMAIGWLKPVVLLPASMLSGLSTPQLEMLLLHELAHIRRHDYLVNFFQSLVEILLFFHPSVHWVSKQMRNEREYCSDDIAVQHCGDAVAYAHTLADTASLCTKAHHHHTIPNMAMAASGGDLKQRVIRLVDHHCAPKNNISKWFASATIVLSVIVLSSKQLLIMPLLDIDFNEKTSQYPGNTAERQQNNIQTGNFIPESSIAQQLLTPQTSELNIPRLFDLTIPSFTKGALTQQQQDVNQNFTTRMLEESLTPTPYFQNIETVETQTNLVKTTQIEKPKNPNSIFFANLANVENKKRVLSHVDNKTTISARFIDHISRQKEEWVKPIVIVNESISPISPVWHSAEQVKKVIPEYPTIAKRRGIEIDIKVDFTIDVDGQIKDIKFAQHKKSGYFKKSIRSAIEKWRFVPAKVNEKPVESQMAKVFSFNLQS
jgi:TonB family protein